MNSTVSATPIPIPKTPVTKPSASTRSKPQLANICNLTPSWSRSSNHQRERMKDELCRMKVNLEARMKKGVSARSDSEFISKVGDCLKEETGYWLELLVDSG